MKYLIIFLVVSSLFCAYRKSETVYVGSTPANEITKTFLGIRISDSVDFVKWRLVVNSNRYVLECRYGIAKPATSGFINGGKSVNLSGRIESEVNRYTLRNGEKTISFFKLDDNLLHLLDPSGSLAAGTSGWSYTLNAENRLTATTVNVNKHQFILTDSIKFSGRSPCTELTNISGLQLSGDCQRLKWALTLYADPRTNQPTSFLLKGTAFEGRAAGIGKWSIMNTRNGAQLYKLDLGPSEGSVYFIRPDEDVLAFANANGNPFVGNELFSYTLSKKTL